MLSVNISSLQKPVKRAAYQYLKVPGKGGTSLFLYLRHFQKVHQVGFANLWHAGCRICGYSR